MRRHPSAVISSRRLRQRLIPRLLLANFLGAVFIAAYLEMTAKLPRGVSRGEQAVGRATGLVISFAVLALLALTYFRRRFLPEWRWLDEARAPTPSEREALLTQPWRMTRHAFLIWVATAVALGLGVALPDGDLRYVVVTFVSVLLGGTAACTLTYLVIEAVLRPAFALALEGRTPEPAPGPGLGQRLFLAWALGSGVPLLGVAVTPLVRQKGAAAPVWAPMVLLGVVGLLAGARLTGITARSVAAPMRRLGTALRRVQQGDLDVRLLVDDGGEIGVVQAGFNEMTAGLREREHLRDLFGRYVGEEVARRALEEGVELGGELRHASVHFVDIVGSTALAQRLPPTEVVTLLNRFFQAVVRSADAEGGWLNKFEGDGALCVFGAPAPDLDHAAQALRAARSLLDELRHLELDAGIGVSSGEVVAGNVGAEHRHEYTVIGQPVNEAARLTEAAKRRAGRVLASAVTVAASGEEGRAWVQTEPVELRGIPGAVMVYEPVATSLVPRST